MFRLFRAPVLILLAFAAGILFERFTQSDRCAKNGGQWDSAGYCAFEGR
ncbi:MAG: hypothetical protein QNJ09_11330 [Paracoccaceae bacterium]|nr:hypothetical protein [Paracoccaceae bacterium]